MKNKKGFTLIEIIAVITIIGILLLIAIPEIYGYLIRGTKEYYSDLEKTVMLSGRDYLDDYKQLLPEEVENVTVIPLEELVTNKYIDEVVDEDGNSCSGRVIARKNENKEYEYYTCLICENYETEGEACNYTEDNNVTADSKNYRLEVEKDRYTVKQGEDFKVPYAKAYYTLNGVESLVSDKVEGNPKKIDTNRLGEVEITYVYQGARKSIIVEVIDDVVPTIPQVVLRKDNAKGNLYNGNWYSGDIYEEYQSTDYGKNGILGSDIDYYEISTDGRNYTKLESNYHISSNNGVQNYYVRSVDKSGNRSESNTYQLKIDKEYPTCELKSSGTNGNSGWYTSDATIEFKSKEDKVSGIKESKIDSPKVTSDSKNKKITGTVIDEAGNKTECSTTVNVDKTNPTVTYNLGNGIYNANKSIVITASDTYYSYMNIKTTNNGAVVNNDNNIKEKSKSYNLTHGKWEVTATAYDESGRNVSESRNYTIDTKAPSCSLKVTKGTSGSNGWYTSDVTIGFNTTDGTGTNIKSQVINTPNINANGTYTVKGTVIDEAGNAGACNLTVKVDKNGPTLSTNVTQGTYTESKNVTITATDPDSGIEIMDYELTLNGIKQNGNNNYTSNSLAVQLNQSGTWIIKVRTKNQAGIWSNYTSYTYTINLCSFPVGQTWEFNYGSGLQNFSIPCNGVYQIEASGAQGGSFLQHIGGFGGTVNSRYSFTRNDLLQIYPGGMGNGTAGGTNGYGYQGNNSNSEGAGGGASTVVQLVRNGASSILLVAAGGGGANADYDGLPGGNSTTSKSSTQENGGGGGGYQNGSNGSTMIMKDPLILYSPVQNQDGSYKYSIDNGINPDKTNKNNWIINSTRDDSGYVDYSGGDDDGYVENFNNLYGYRQISPNGWLTIFTGYFTISNSPYIKITAFADAANKYIDTNFYDSHPEFTPIDEDQTSIELVDANGNVLAKETARQARENGRYSISNHGDSTPMHNDYDLSIIYTVPPYLNKVAVKLYLKFSTGDLAVNNGGKNSGILLTSFYTANPGYGSEGGSNYFNTGYNANNTFSQAGMNNGNGKAKITLVSID